MFYQIEMMTVAGILGMNPRVVESRLPEAIIEKQKFRLRDALRNRFIDSICWRSSCSHWRDDSKARSFGKYFARCSIWRINCPILAECLPQLCSGKCVGRCSDRARAEEDMVSIDVHCLAEVVIGV